MRATIVRGCGGSVMHEDTAVLLAPGLSSRSGIFGLRSATHGGQRSRRRSAIWSRSGARSRSSLSGWWWPVPSGPCATRRAGNAFPASSRHPARWRTDSGRLTKREGGQEDQLPGLYFPLAVAVMAAARAVTAALGASKLTVGYVIYCLMAVAFLIVPNVLAFWIAKEVPFPTLFRTLSDLDKRWHSAVMVVAAGLPMLAVHLVAYPWP